MNKILTLQDNLLKNGVNTAILLTVLVLSASLLVLTPLNFFIMAAVLAIFTIFVIRPDICYYFMIFTIPFTERLRILPISFSLNDVLVFVCGITVFLNLILRNERVSLKTKIDKWILVLLVLYFAAGMYSIYDRGILSSFKFLEAVLAYYMTIYFIRSKQVKISGIIRLLVIAGIFQAIIGILQSVTGQFGAGFQSDRGYLGYLGIGPKVVWHAWGTFGGNGSLPNFLTMILFFVLPFHKYLNKKKRNLILLIFLTAIYMGYSKESLLTFITCASFYMIYTSQDIKKTIMNCLKFFVPLAVIGIILINTPFVNTINETLTGRIGIWKYPLTAFANNPKLLVFGTGLMSYWKLIEPLLPPYLMINPEDSHFWLLAHNYYIIVVQETGFVGFIILFSFLFYLMHVLSKNYFKLSGQSRNIFLSSFLMVLPIFTTSFFGQTFMETSSKILFFTLFGMAFAKMQDESCEKKEFLL